MKRIFALGLALGLAGCAGGSAPSPAITTVSLQAVQAVQTNYTLLTTAANACVASGLCAKYATQIGTIEGKWGPVVAGFSTLTPPATLAALVTDLQTLRALPGIGSTVPNPSQTQSDLNSALTTLLSIGQIAVAVAPLL